MIISTVFSFLFATAFYQIFATFTVFGVEIFSSEIPLLLREGVFLLWILVIFILKRDSLKEYFKKWKRCYLSAGILWIFAFLSSYFFFNKSLYDIFVGFKYCFQWILIFLLSTSIGFFYRDQFTSKTLSTRIKWLLAFIVIFWFLWQIMKIVSPSFFEFLGYTLHLNDYQYGTNPPIYYLTGYEGTLRRQGLFSGPNNYGYFLCTFFPLVLLFFGEKIKQWKTFSFFQWVNISILIVRILAMICTFSRAVLVAWLASLIILNRNTLKKRKKILIGVMICGLLWVIGISLWKRDSTSIHLQKLIEAISVFISNPLGYGLGSSGPAVHHNGIFLPENYFFQILFDTGTIGFLCFLFFCFQLLWICWLLTKKEISSNKNSDLPFIFLMFKRFSIGLFALCVMGMFLHSFEDSMVNYLFFVLFWIIIGKLSFELPWEMQCCNPFSPKFLKQLKTK